MMKLSADVCVDAPAKQVWAVLSKLDGIQDWSGTIHRSYCEGDQTRGVDAMRVCELRGNVTIKETIIAWDEGRSFTYVGQGIPLLKHAQNTWSIEERGKQTIVTSVAKVEFKGGMLGRLLEPFLVVASKHEGYKSLARFKYLVENGKPYQGNERQLFKVALTC